MKPADWWRTAKTQVRTANILVWLLVLFPFVAGLGGCAQKRPARTFPEASAELQLGQTVLVAEVGGGEVSGKLASLSGSSLSVEQDGGIRVFEADAIARISRRGDSLVNGALIGLGSGVGVGLISALGSESTGNPMVDTGAAGGVLLAASVAGLGLGILVDALITRPVTVYIGAPPAARTGTTTSRAPGRSVHVVWRF